MLQFTKIGKIVKAVFVIFPRDVWMMWRRRDKTRRIQNEEKFKNADKYCGQKTTGFPQKNGD